MLRGLVILLVLVSAVGAQEAPADGPAQRFEERFGSGETPGELTPLQPPVATDPIPPSTQLLAAADARRDAEALPAPVRATRERLAAAARTGDLSALAAAADESRVRVLLDLDPYDDAAALWRSQYPESAGREVLAILLGLLDAPFARLDAGTPNEVYVWPAFAQMSLDALTPPELVEAYRLVTTSDLQRMREAGAWTFFRLGIAPDGTWHYFLVND